MCVQIYYVCIYKSVSHRASSAIYYDYYYMLEEVFDVSTPNYPPPPPRRHIHNTHTHLKINCMKLLRTSR